MKNVSAAALWTLVTALLLVGLVSGTPIRHAVQVVPIVAAGVVARLGFPWSRFAAMPVFALWFLVMLLIWLYLLGVAKVITGKFPPAEIALTIVIGLASAVGLAASLRKSPPSTLRAGAIAFLAFAALQVGAMWLSVRPEIANR